MIDTTFVHAYDEAAEIGAEYRHNMSEINGCIGKIAMAKMQREDLESMGIFTESSNEYYEESVGSAVKQLGDKIIEMINKLKDFINEKIQKIKTHFWKNTDTEKKLEMIKRKDPAALEKIQWAVDAGKIDLNSFKDLNNFYDHIDDVVEKLQKSGQDPHTLKGKLQAAKDTLEKNQKTVAAVAAILGLAATGVAIVMNVNKYKTAKENAEVDFEKASKRGNKTLAQLEEAKKNIEAHQKDDIGAATKLGLLAQMTNEVTSVTKANLSARERILVIIGAKYDAAVQKVYKSLGKSDKITEKRQKMLKSASDKTSKKYSNAAARQAFTNKVMRKEMVDAAFRKDHAENLVHPANLSNSVAQGIKEGIDELNGKR